MSHNAMATRPQEAEAQQLPTRTHRHIVKEFVSETEKLYSNVQNSRTFVSPAVTKLMVIDACLHLL